MRVRFGTLILGVWVPDRCLSPRQVFESQTGVETGFRVTRDWIHDLIVARGFVLTICWICASYRTVHASIITRFCLNSSWHCLVASTNARRLLNFNARLLFALLPFGRPPALSSPVFSSEAVPVVSNVNDESVEGDSSLLQQPWSCRCYLHLVDVIS